MYKTSQQSQSVLFESVAPESMSLAIKTGNLTAPASGYSNRFRADVVPRVRQTGFIKNPPHDEEKRQDLPQENLAPDNNALVLPVAPNSKSFLPNQQPNLPNGQPLPKQLPRGWGVRVQNPNSTSQSPNL
jgi:hypothetical protein